MLLAVIGNPSSSLNSESWGNTGSEESPDGSITTVTFEAKGGKTVLSMHERFPNAEALQWITPFGDSMILTKGQ